MNTNFESRPCIFQTVYNTEVQRRTEYQEKKDKSQKKQFQCNMCGRSYIHQPNLSRHKRYECINVEPQFFCNFCGRKFRQKQALSNHNIRCHSRLNVHF